MRHIVKPSELTSYNDYNSKMINTGAKFTMAIFSALGTISAVAGFVLSKTRNRITNRLPLNRNQIKLGGIGAALTMYGMSFFTYLTSYRLSKRANNIANDILKFERIVSNPKTSTIEAIKAADETINKHSNLSATSEAMKNFSLCSLSDRASYSLYSDIKKMEYYRDALIDQIKSDSKEARVYQENKPNYRPG